MEQEPSDTISLPAHVAGSGTLDRLVDAARDYARAAASDNTLKAYSRDWAHFARWCRMKGVEPLPPSPEIIGLYLVDLASGFHLIALLAKQQGRYRRIDAAGHADNNFCCVIEAHA